MDIITIGPTRMIAAYVFLLVLLLIVQRLRIGREREIVISTVRMSLQLVIMGYVLAYILEVNHALLAIALLLLMQTFAVHNVLRRVNIPLGHVLVRAIAISVLAGTTITLLYFLVIVVGVQPWYETQYFVPIAGMLIGNSMTGASLGAERLIDGVKARKSQVEGALMLGATPSMAMRSVVSDAFAAAILPTINSMVGMGIVFLPGMMTGQILSGVSPLTAIEYQIAIMLGIVGSVALTVFVLLELGHKAFFNDRAQIRQKFADSEK